MAIRQEIPTHDPAAWVGAGPPPLQVVATESPHPDESPDPDTPPDLWDRLIVLGAGGVAVVAGAWGGVAPSVTRALRHPSITTWAANLQHGPLALVPGILAVIGGTVLALAVGMSRRRASVWVRRGVTVALVLLGVSALWFLVEASLWTIYLTSHTVTASVSMRTFTHVVGPSSLDSVAAAVATAAAGWWVVRSPGQYRVA